MILTAIIASTLLLVTLAWNDVIQSVIKKYYPKNNKNNKLYGKIMYALTVSFIVLLIQMHIFPHIRSIIDNTFNMSIGQSNNL